MFIGDIKRISVEVFENKKTGEIRFFLSDFVEKVGVDKIIEILDQVHCELPFQQEARIIICDECRKVTSGRCMKHSTIGLNYQLGDANGTTAKLE